MRKRLYVQAKPYLVTSCSRAGQLLPPPVNRARTSGPEFVWDEQQQPALAAAGDQQQQQQEEEAGQPAAAAAAAATAAAITAVAFAPAPGSALPQAGGTLGGVRLPLSLADRYQQMQATVGNRVCSGKSAIHGLGAFAKVPHKAGAFVPSCGVIDGRGLAGSAVQRWMWQRGWGMPDSGTMNEL
jgi:hypothetical protein